MGSESRKRVPAYRNQSGAAQIARGDMLHALSAVSHTSPTPASTQKFIDEAIRASKESSQIKILRTLLEPVHAKEHKVAKRALRTSLREQRKATHKRLDGSHAATEIWNALNPVLQKQDLPRGIAAYEALPGELSISKFATSSKTSETEVWLPVVSSAKGIPLSELPIGFIASGQPTSVGDPARIDPPVSLVLVPAMAVDEDGVRLGQGGGWYDRALAAIKQAQPTALFFAAVPQNTYVNRGLLPAEPHDIHMDGVITEAGWALFYPLAASFLKRTQNVAQARPISTGSPRYRASTSFPTGLYPPRQS
ncbi:MAG: 5-formyltetrahydrofolate cyclo-ligase [Actinomyces sp.]|nr:5-formyltetrahydrofolate cyclo-ligase [Actinomyces sp.]